MPKTELMSAKLNDEIIKTIDDFTAEMEHHMTIGSLIGVEIKVSISDHIKPRKSVKVTCSRYQEQVVTVESIND